MQGRIGESLLTSLFTWTYPVEVLVTIGQMGPESSGRFSAAGPPGSNGSVTWPGVYDRAMSTQAEVTAFVLAGGKSTRMGTDKAFVRLDGRTLLERALDVARAVTSDVRIVGEPRRFAAFAPVVEDEFPGCGPLGGIHAALRSSTCDLNVIVAVDLPFISSALLQFLIGQARDSAAVVIVPRTVHGWQPLCAIYRREFANLADTALRAGRYKVDALFAEARVEAIGEDALRSGGFGPELFRNLNTPEDLAEAQTDNDSP